MTLESLKKQAEERDNFNKIKFAYNETVRSFRDDETKKIQNDFRKFFSKESFDIKDSSSFTNGIHYSIEAKYLDLKFVLDFEQPSFENEIGFLTSFTFSYNELKYRIKAYFETGEENKHRVGGYQIKDEDYLKAIDSLKDEPVLFFKYNKKNDHENDVTYPTIENILLDIVAKIN